MVYVSNNDHLLDWHDLGARHKSMMTSSPRIFQNSYDHILTIFVLRSDICDYTAMQYERFLYYRRSCVEQVTLYLEIATGVGGAVPLPMCGRQLLAWRVRY